MNTKLLKQKILDLAIRGKLSQQLKSDGNTADLLKEISSAGHPERSAKGAKSKDLKQIIPLDKSEAPFEIPANWEWVRLGDVGVYKKGPFGSALTKSMFVPKGPNTIKVYEQKNAIRKNESIGDYYITREYFDSAMKGFEVFPGDILVSCAGTIGETFILPKGCEQGIINQALMKMKIFSFVDVDYFLYYFDFVLKAQSEKEGKGTAIKNIPPFAVFKEFPFPLPPLAEQQRIVAKIEEAFAEIDAIEKNKELLKTHIKQTRQKILDLAIHGKLVPQNKSDEPASVLLERITRDNPHYEKLTDIPFEIPKSWEWIKLGDVVKQVTDFVASGSFASLRENVKYYKEENYAILVRTLDFRNNFEKDLTYTDKHGYEFLSNSNLFGGELLLSNIGSIGKVFIVPKLNKRMTLAPNSIMVRHYDDSQRDWLYYFFLSPVGQEVLLSISSSTTQAKFNKTQLKGVLVPLPPLAEQKRIVDKIEEIFASLDEISLHLV